MSRQTARFVHDPPPTEAEELPDYLSNTFEGLSTMVNSPTRNYAPMNTEPPKPTDGDMAFANGTGWEPGDGRGMYFYDNEHWAKFAPSDSVVGAIPVGAIVLWTGSVVPFSWTLCDGTPAPDGTPTPDLTNQFVKGSSLGEIGTTGGSNETGNVNLTISQMARHTHTQQGTFSSNKKGLHSHTTNTTGNHNHGGPNFIVGPGIAIQSGSGAGGVAGQGANANISTDGNHSHTTNETGEHGHTTTISGETNDKGSGSAHRHTMDPPYYKLAYIMRYE